jgi:uncharacterized Tic20 family protein
MSHAPDNPYAAPQEYEYPEITSEARNWAMFCHLSALFFLGMATIVHIVGPLVVWLMKRDDHPFIDEHGKESVNFQITITIYTLLLLPLVCIVIGIPLLIALWIANIVFVIIAAVKASNGEAYRYPLTIRLIS